MSEEQPVRTVSCPELWLYRVSEPAETVEPPPRAVGISSDGAPLIATPGSPQLNPYHMRPMSVRHMFDKIDWNKTESRFQKNRSISPCDKSEKEYEVEDEEGGEDSEEEIYSEVQAKLERAV